MQRHQCNFCSSSHCTAAQPNHGPPGTAVVLPLKLYTANLLRPTALVIPSALCVITGLTDDWPASKRWTPEELLKHYRDHRFKVRKGKGRVHLLLSDARCTFERKGLRTGLNHYSAQRCNMRNTTVHPAASTLVSSIIYQYVTSRAPLLCPLPHANSSIMDISYFRSGGLR